MAIYASVKINELELVISTNDLQMLVEKIKQV
jgi:hypothetical protein